MMIKILPSLILRFSFIALLMTSAYAQNKIPANKIYSYSAKILCSQFLFKGGLVLGGLVSTNGKDSIVLGYTNYFTPKKLIAEKNYFFATDLTILRNQGPFTIYSGLQRSGFLGHENDSVRFFYNKDSDSLITNMTASINYTFNKSQCVTTPGSTYNTFIKLE